MLEDLWLKFADWWVSVPPAICKEGGELREILGPTFCLATVNGAMWFLAIVVGLGVMAIFVSFFEAASPLPGVAQGQNHDHRLGSCIGKASDDHATC
jgi:hypothetical protein